MSVEVATYGTDLIEQVKSRLKGREKDYRSSLVVFPGKRPGHFLRKGLAQELGSSFIPPVIYSIDEFIDSICADLGFVKKLETIDAVALLYDIHKKAPNHLGGSGFMTPDSFLSLGIKIFRDIEELTIEGVKSQQLNGVETYIKEGIPKHSAERLQSLTYFYEEFYKKVDSLGFSTRSTRYRFAAKRLDQAGLDRFDSIVIAGFFALTDAEKSVFRALLSYDNAIFIFQHGVGLDEYLKDLGIRPEPTDIRVKKPEVHFYSSPDTHGQVLALSGLLEARLESEISMDENTVIVLPSSDTLFPLLRQGLANIDEESYNVSLGYPLFRTPVFGFLNSLMELVSSMDKERIYIPDYLKFVLHPYAKNIFFNRNSETTRILFHTLEEELLRNKPKTFTTLSEIEASEALFREVTKKIRNEVPGTTEERLRDHLKEIHKITIGNFISFRNIADFARKCIDLLVYLFHNSPAKLHPLFHPFSESFIETLDVLSRSLMKDIVFADRSSYFTFLRKYISTCHVPFPGTPLRGLQVLGALETRNLKFKTVFVLDANEEVLPETKKEESLIPFKAREILGLSTYRDRDKLTEYYFDTLLGGATDVHLFFIENEKTEKSRIVERLLWEKQKRDKTTDPRRYIKPIQYQVNLVNKNPKSIAKTKEVITFLRDFTFSATALDRYLKCPLQFYYASVLGLRPKEEMSGDVERNELGNFIHTVLSAYFSVRIGNPLKENDLKSAQMDALVEDLFAKRYGKDPSGALYLLKRQVKKHMDEYLENYTIPLVKDNSVTILGCEKKINANVNYFKLAGRIDSIEQRNNRIFIVDYKTGSNPARLKIDLTKLDIERRNSWGKAIGSLQLPFYILLYSEKEKRPIEELEALYLLLGRSKIGKEIELPLFNGASPDEVYAPLKTVILKLLQELTDPFVAFDPAIDMKLTCPTCDFQYICGTQWII